MELTSLDPSPLPRQTSASNGVTPVSRQPRELTTLSRAFWPGLDFLKAQGLRADALLGSAGYSERELREPERRIPRRATLSVLRALKRVCTQPAPGFALAAHVSSETFDLLEYMARASATLRDAVAVANRYARIVDDSCRFSLGKLDNRVIWRLDMDWPADVEPLVVEFVMGILSVVGHRLFGSVVPVEELWLRWPAPEPNNAYVRPIGYPVRFEAPYNAVVFSPGVLETSLSGADPALAKLLARQADSMLARMPQVDSLSGQVRGLLAEELRGREPSMHRIARRLGTTPSTLRRRLSAEGTSFKRLLELTRLDVARACLADPRLSINETAFLLGYSDASTFFKFFRRSTGRTPSEYRQSAKTSLQHPPPR